MKKHKLVKGIAISVICVLVIGIAVALFYWLRMPGSLEADQVPPITASPVSADQLYVVSKFRSGSGHDFSNRAWDGETCRSMKHYFNKTMKFDENRMPVRSQPTAEYPNIKIFAPFDGNVTDINSDRTPLGKQVTITSNKNPNFYVRLFHIDLLPGVGKGTKVTSGQQIATVGPMDGIDVSYEGLLRNTKVVYLSVFDYMTDEVFSPFKAMGKTRSDFVLTREQADALNLKCDGEKFISDRGDDSQFFVQLKDSPFKMDERMGERKDIRENDQRIDDRRGERVDERMYQR